MSTCLQTQQSALTEAIRNPHILSDHPGISLYQTLVMNVFDDLISRCFPVLQSILPPETWKNLLSDFIHTSTAKTPLFYELSGLFVHYLEGVSLENYPFAHALAHYEWIELAVELATDEPENIKQEIQDPTTLPFRLASTARMMQYEYDVENISVSYQPQEKKPSFFIVYRNEKDKVQFIRINALAFSLLSQLISSKTPATAILLDNLIDQKDSKAHQQWVGHCRRLLKDLMQEGILIPI